MQVIEPVDTVAESNRNGKDCLTSAGSRRRSRTPKRRRRTRRIPPGQRLIRCIFIACLACLVFPIGAQLDSLASRKEDSHRVMLEPPFSLTTEMKGLKEALAKLNTVKTNKPGLFAIEIDTGKYVDLAGHTAFSAASMIKIPVMVSFLSACELGRCKMSDQLTIRKDLITSGSGFLQWRKPGSKISARRAAQLMIVVSDNTATNMIIDHLGGLDVLNKDFRRWGLKKTKLNNLLIDLEGTNKTSPYDLVYLLGRVDHGELIGGESRQFMYDAMKKCRNRSLLPRGISAESKIIHKTGTLGLMIGDAGIVTTGKERRYAIAIQVERKRNDRRANMLIRKMSKLVFDQFSK